MSLEWEQIVVDAAQPAALGRWWANALGWVVTFEADEEYEIRSAPDRLPGLVFVPVRDPKVTKNRLRLDFRPDDQTAGVDRLLALGAHVVDVGQVKWPWVVPKRSCRSPALHGMVELDTILGFNRPLNYGRAAG